MYMFRTQIYLDSTQRKILKTMAAERKATLSELIREAIWSLISTHQKPKTDSLQDIVGLYHNEKDREGSIRHDDLYE